MVAGAAQLLVWFLRHFRWAARGQDTTAAAALYLTGTSRSLGAAGKAEPTGDISSRKGCRSGVLTRVVEAGRSVILTAG